MPGAGRGTRSTRHPRQATFSPANTMDPQPATTAPSANPAAPAAAGASTTEHLAKPALSEALTSEIDEAMAALGLGPAAPKQQQGGKKGKTPAPAPHDAVTPIGGPAKAKVHGPRVVQAGREHRTGTVVSVGPTDIFIEFGPKELGVAPRAQWPDDALPAVGQEFEVVVDRFETAESIFICSRPGTVQKADWEILEIGQIVEARVTGVNKGGLELEVAGHRAFMPASQVALDRIEDLSVFIGQKFPCQVSQLDRRGRGNIVLSRRDILEQERKEKAGKLRDTLKEGDIRDGTVRKIMPFGAFVDIGGLDGLVHVADLSHDRVGFGEGAVAKHIKEGQNVRVQILKLDWDNNRISLGMKQLQADPFRTAVADIKEGADVSGRITRLADFGAFVEISPGVEGLVHVSEIAHRRINVPGDVLKSDEIVQARVLKIDPETRRISLSIKALLPAPEAKPGRGGDRGKPAGRSPEEIAKETPAQRRMREQSKSKKLTGGFGAGLEGGGLGDLKWKG
jgi:small subunit ribosomal protein S1